MHNFPLASAVGSVLVGLPWSPCCVASVLVGLPWFLHLRKQASKQFSVQIHGLREGKSVTSRPVKKFWEALWSAAWWSCYWRPWVGCWHGSWASGMLTAWVHRNRYGLRSRHGANLWELSPTLISSLLGLKQLILLLVLYWSTGDSLILGSTEAGLPTVC